MLLDYLYFTVHRDNVLVWVNQDQVPIFELIGTYLIYPIGDGLAEVTVEVTYY